jgi:hypothetical protein
MAVTTGLRCWTTLALTDDRPHACASALWLLVLGGRIDSDSGSCTEALDATFGWFG